MKCYAAAENTLLHCMLAPAVGLGDRGQFPDRDDDATDHRPVHGCRGPQRQHWSVADRRAHTHVHAHARPRQGSSSRGADVAGGGRSGLLRTLRWTGKRAAGAGPTVARPGGGCAGSTLSRSISSLPAATILQRLIGRPDVIIGGGRQVSLCRKLSWSGSSGRTGRV